MYNNNLTGGGILLNRRKFMEVKEAPFEIKGKFSDSSTHSEWWIRPFGDRNGKIDISELVNAESKEFIYRLPKKPTAVSYAFYYHPAIERIDYIQGIEECINFYGLISHCPCLKSIDMSMAKNSVNEVTNWMVESNPLLEKASFGENFIIVPSETSGFPLSNNVALTDLEIYIDWHKATTTIGLGFNSSLTNLRGEIRNIVQNLDIKDCPLLTQESLQLIIDGLVHGEEQRTLTMRSAQRDRLSDEQRDLISLKNWKITIR